MFVYLIPSETISDKYSYPHFTDEETKVQRVQVTQDHRIKMSLWTKFLCPPPELIYWSLIPSVIVFSGRALGDNYGMREKLSSIKLVLL